MKLIGKRVLMAIAAVAMCCSCLAKFVIAQSADSTQEYYARADAGSAIPWSATSQSNASNEWIWQDVPSDWGTNIGDDFFAGNQNGGDSGNGGDGGGGGDASDPTNVTFHVMTNWEWQRLNNNQGNLIAFKVSPYIPITLGQQKFLFNIEVPLPQYAGLTGISHSSGLGDTRLKFFWLIPTEREKVRAVVPSIDAFAPTGDADRGLGGGQWILMPNVVFALQPAKNLSMYPFFRYVHAEEVQTNLVPGLPLPEDPNLFGSTRLRGFNLEWNNVIQLEDAFFNWIEITPDYFKNFTANRSETFTMKYTAAKELRDGLFMMFDFWHPVGGSQTNDYTFRIRFDWYPQTDNAKCSRCRKAGCRRRCAR